MSPKACCGLAPVLLALGGCISWDAGWTNVPPGEGARETVDALLRRAESQVAAADTTARLEAVIATFEAVLRIEPDHPEALGKLAMYHTLLGAGHRESRGDKQAQYRQALRLGERLMYRNPRFKALVDRGEEVWDASRVLTAEEADGMGWWSTAMFYYFKECVPDIFKIFNNRWVRRNKQIMDRLSAVAPGWHGGANEFNLGIYYLALPESVGGDMKKSARYLARAENRRPDRLLVKWGRAKYFHYKRGDRDGFRRDLEWVLAQDPRVDTGDPYPWNVYFQRDARAMLGQIDELF